jgi:outer membrane protein OmpA-like peptidoglycan-associated protein
MKILVLIICLVNGLTVQAEQVRSTTELDGDASVQSIIEGLSVPESVDDDSTEGVISRKGFKKVPKVPSVALKVEFEFGQSDLTDSGKATLDSLTTAIQSNQLKYKSFAIEGHTDAVGDEKYNQILSERRAEVVTVYLMNRGVSEDRLRWVGYGETRLLQGCAENDARQRRVEIVRDDL